MKIHAVLAPTIVVQYLKSTTKTPAIAGVALDGPAIAGDQSFKESKKEGPGHFEI